MSSCPYVCLYVAKSGYLIDLLILLSYGSYHFVFHSISLQFFSRFIILHVEPQVAQTNSIKKLQAALNSKATPSEKLPYVHCMLAYAQFFHLDDSLRTSDKNYDRGLVHVCNTIQVALPGSFFIRSEASLFNSLCHPLTPSNRCCYNNTEF